MSGGPPPQRAARVRARAVAGAGAWAAAVAGALLLEHFLVHRGVILPTTAAAGGAPLWMWAALRVPELAVCFVAGWRLRSWRSIAACAVGAAIVREAVLYLLFVLREPGHEVWGGSRERIVPVVVALAYALVLAVASATSRADAALARR